MSSPLHSWWLSEYAEETTFDFEPVKDSAGNQIYAPSPGGDDAVFGTIKKTVWKVVVITAVTQSPNIPSVSGLVSNGNLIIPYAQGTESKTIAPYGNNQWQWLNPQTTRDDYILGTWAHSYTVKCGNATYTQGVWSDVDAPLEPPD